MKKKNELVVIDSNQLNDTISHFNAPMTEYFNSIGLPTDEVLYPIEDRMTILREFGNALKELDIDKRRKSTYLTKFGASIFVGLFDGAITYLWNETIKSIRQMVVDFDLNFFYTIAKEINSRYKNLDSIEDLAIIGEYDLLTICNRIGLLDDHVFEVFKYINYMRNHASSAHPNENRVGAFDILSWLDNCIKYAINAEPNAVTMELKQLLHNIRNEEIPEEDFRIIGAKIQNYPIDTIDTVLQTLFGQYIDTKTKISTKKNIEHIAPYVWDSCSQDKKYEVGEKYGYFRNTGSSDKRDLTLNFLTLVNGVGYRDEDSIAADIRISLNDLKSTHFSSYNFYNEAPIARELFKLIPNNGVIPESVRLEWIKTVIICYCGNGLGYYGGVDLNAVSLYEDAISNFNRKDIYLLMTLLNDRELLTDLDSPIAKKRFLDLIDSFSETVKNSVLIELIQFIIDFDSKRTIKDELHNNRDIGMISL